MIGIFYFLKFLEFVNELEKTLSIGENGMNPLGNPLILKKIWPQGPVDIYF